MALTAEDKKEVHEIIEKSFRAKDIDISIMRQQWKKFKENPEARLAALEVKVEDLTYEFREFKKEMRDGFKKVNERFEGIDKTLLDLHKALNDQVWKFLGGLGVVLILLKLAGALFP